MFFFSKLLHFLISTEAQNESLKVLKLAWNNIRLGGASSIINGLKVLNNYFSNFIYHFLGKCEFERNRPQLEWLRNDSLC